ncbi:hypothetical protein HDE_13998 [Halotydeus destructor]|nr:hypothetical protein HDE_13998 [Halotydeus destructor]
MTTDKKFAMHLLLKTVVDLVTTLGIVFAAEAAFLKRFSVTFAFDESPIEGYTEKVVRFGLHVMRVMVARKFLPGILHAAHYGCIKMADLIALHRIPGLSAGEEGAPNKWDEGVSEHVAEGLMGDNAW